MSAIQQAGKPALLWLRLRRAAGFWLRQVGLSAFGFRLSLVLATLSVICFNALALDLAGPDPVLPSVAFPHACAAYASSDYAQAAELFRGIAAQRPSANVFHNLGNAEWKLGHTGEAMLAWERAQWLDPFGANTRANVRFARKAAQLPTPDLTWYEICSTWLPVDVWAWIAGAGFWIAVTLTMLPGIFRWRKAGWQQALAAAGFAACLLTLPSLVGIHTRSALGVVLAPDAPLRLTPTQEAQVLTKLPAGEMARLERARGGYVYLRSGNDAAGWVRRKEFGLICGK
jgi:tetratricopeptide (TPR) repeat protein